MTERPTADTIVTMIRATVRGEHVATAEEAVELVESYASIVAGERVAVALRESAARVDKILATAMEAPLSRTTPA